MLSTQPNPMFSVVAEIEILNCSGCGKPMRLGCIEPDNRVSICAPLNAQSAISRKPSSLPFRWASYSAVYRGADGAGMRLPVFGKQ